MYSTEQAEQNIVISRSGENTFTASFLVPQNFPPLDGHFPDFKILPGVAQLLLVTISMRKLFGEMVQLQEIQKVKFTNPALPEKELQIACKLDFDQERSCCSVQAKLTSEEKNISTMKLLYANVRIP